MPILWPFLDEVYHVSVAANDILLETFDIYSFFDVFSNLQINAGRFEKIHNLFVINFEIAAFNQER